MKKYETPEIKEIKVQVEDVIATSAGVNEDYAGQSIGGWGNFGHEYQ